MISVGTALKTILQLILFLVFLFDYGLPAIYKYLEEKTIRIKVEKQGNGIEAPAITLAAWNKDTSIGWRNKSKEIVHDFDALRFQCKHFDDIVQCVTNQTYEQSDFVKDIIIGYEEKQSLLSSSNFLVEDFTNVRYGRTYTLNQDRMIGPDYEKDYQLFSFWNRNFFTVSLCTIKDSSWQTRTPTESPGSTGKSTQGVGAAVERMVPSTL